MMVCAVIDTNVLVSALLSPYPDSATVVILNKIQDGSVCPVYNGEILDEYRAVLARPKFSFPENLVDDFLSMIIRRGMLLDNRVNSGLVFADPGDAVFYEVALSVEGAIVVTGNGKHFPDSPIVMTPNEFLAFLASEA